MITEPVIFDPEPAKGPIFEKPGASGRFGSLLKRQKILSRLAEDIISNYFSELFF